MTGCKTNGCFIRTLCQSTNKYLEKKVKKKTDYPLTLMFF